MKHFTVELIGTFFFTLALALTTNPMCYGLNFASLIYLGVHMSGGYYNTAITVALYLHGKLKEDYVCHLIIAQVIGAVLALCLVRHATESSFMLTIERPHMAMACLGEVLFTFLLCALILSLCAQKAKELHGIIIGFTMISLGYIGGIFNPAISLANQIVCFSCMSQPLDVHSLIAYFFAPLAGGVIAAITYKYYQD